MERYAKFPARLARGLSRRNSLAARQIALYWSLMRHQEFEQQAQAVAQDLHQLIRMEKRSQRSIEQQLGMGSAILSKLLNGTIRLQYSHVLMVLSALGMTPGQFFRVVYPDPGPENPTLVELGKQKGGQQAEDSPEFDGRVLRALVRLLGQLQSEA